MTGDFYQFLFNLRASGMQRPLDQDVRRLMYDADAGRPAFGFFVDRGDLSIKGLNGEVGVLDHQVLTNLRNMVCSLATAMALTAGDAKVNLTNAASLCDYYIHRAGRLTQPEQFEALINEMIGEYRELIEQARDLHFEQYSAAISVSIDYISANLFRRLTAEEVASHAGYSLPYLNRLFKKETGRTVYGFIQETKIKESRRALLLTERTLTEIASSLGYHSLSHFSKAFKAATGMSPQQYRLRGTYEIETPAAASAPAASAVSNIPAAEVIFSRTRMLLGDSAMDRLSSCRVLIFGLGGVGAAAAEALARSGIGALDLCDHDRVAPSNLNRQLIATQHTLGQRKVDAAAERIASINPFCRVKTWPVFFLPETMHQFDFSAYDYVVDCIDTVTGKLALIEAAKSAGVPVISSMGTGNKLDPTKLELADIYDTSVCPLAKVMRRECRRRGIKDLKVVYSKEEPRTPLCEAIEDDAISGNSAADRSVSDNCIGVSRFPENVIGEEDVFGSEISENSTAETARPRSRRSTPGSVSYVPPVAGMILAGEVVRELASAVSH